MGSLYNHFSNFAISHEPQDLSYTVPETRQISENLLEEVPWGENFSVIRGNDD
jgi:hypothetical protein